MSQYDGIVGHSESRRPYQRFDSQFCSEEPLLTSDLDGKNSSPDSLMRLSNGTGKQVSHYKSDASDPLLGGPAEKSSGCFAKIAYEGGWKTKVARSLLVAAAAAGTLFLIVSNPAGWVIGTVAGTAFLVSLIAQQVLHINAEAKIDAQEATRIIREQDPDKARIKTSQMRKFKRSAWWRLHGGWLKHANYNMVFETRPEGPRIILGSLHNNKSGDLRNLIDNEEVRAVLSINERWELLPWGESDPVRSQQWEGEDVHYQTHDVLDHQFLTPQVLDNSADFIHAQLQAGDNVFVNCRGGVGRSAMAVAAYLMKYQGMTPELAAEQIKGNRSNSTIRKKLDNHPTKGAGLRSFAHYLFMRNPKLNHLAGYEAHFAE